MTTPVRVFLSYAHDSTEHVAQVRELWLQLRVLGIDVVADLTGPGETDEPNRWTADQLREADFVLIVVSAEWHRDVTRVAPVGDAQVVREAVFRNRPAARYKYFPVLLPGASLDDLPGWLGPQVFAVTAVTPAGLRELVTVLTAGEPTAEARHELSLEVTVEGGEVRSVVALAGSPLCRRLVPAPYGADELWDSLDLPPAEAEAKMVGFGRRLGRTLFDEDALRTIMKLINLGGPDSVIDVVISTGGDGLTLPYEVIRLPDDRVLATVPSVRFTRRLRGVSRPATAAWGGALKILEVTMPAQIAGGLQATDYHVLHLSPHRSQSTVESEVDADAAASIEDAELVQALRGVAKAMPLVVLSRCVDRKGGDTDLATALIHQGADRVIALQAPVSQRYANELATALYEGIAERNLTVAGALAWARAALYAQAREDEQLGGRAIRPEYGVATLIAATEDAPLLAS